MLCYIDLLQQLQTYSSTRFETFRAVPIWQNKTLTQLLIVLRTTMA